MFGTVCDCPPSPLLCMWLSQEALRSQESPDPKETLFHSLRTSWHVDRENLTPFFEKYIFLNKSRKCRNAVFKASKVKNFDQLLRLKKLVFIMNAFEESLFKVALFKKKPKRSFGGQTTVGKISHFSDEKKIYFPNLNSIFRVRISEKAKFPTVQKIFLGPLMLEIFCDFCPIKLLWASTSKSQWATKTAWTQLLCSVPREKSSAILG